MPVTRSHSGKEKEKSATETTQTSSEETSGTTETTVTGTTRTTGTTETSATGTSREEKTDSAAKTTTPCTPPAPLPAPVPLAPAEDTRTLRAASRAGSRRSVASRKRLLAELEAKERLAKLQLEQIRATAELEKIRLQRMRAESSSSEDEEEDREAATERVDMWLERHQQPLLAIEEQGRPPSPAPHPATTHEDNIGHCENETGRGQEVRPQRECGPRTERVASPARPAKKEDPERGQGARATQEHGPRTGKPASPARSSGDMAALVSAFTEAVRTSSRAPRYHHDLPLFSGQSSEWLTFKAAFIETQDGFTPAENVARLRRSLKGAALEAVTGLLLTGTGPAPIIQALERRFGRPDALVLAEMEKIKALPRVSDSARDVCIFANKIANIVATVEVLKKPQYLHSPEMVRLTVDKLTPLLRNKWYDYAAARCDEAPELKKIADFLNGEADKCAAYAPADTRMELPPRKSEFTTRRPEVPTRRRPDRSYTTEHNRKQKDKCVMCEKDHQLPECSRFQDSTVNTRWEIAKKNNICYRCLRSTHRRADCKARGCGRDGCPMRHHRLLHHEKKPEVAASTERSPPRTPKKPREEVLASTIECSNAAEEGAAYRRAFLKIAPVTLMGPKGERDTYALLDEGSTVTVIDAKLATEVGLDGPREPMTIQGVNGSEITHDYSMRVSAAIRGRHEKQVYVLQDARTVNKIHVFTQAVRARDVRGCRHLQDIRKQLVYEDGKPEILIGQDNWDLIVTRTLRQGKRSQPVASRTRLGWVLHGCRTAATGSIAFCSHLAAVEQTQDPLENLMKKHFELESLGIEARKQKNTLEQRALDLLEKKSRRLPDGRYETGLLWKDESASPPDNYNDTAKRLKTLERKLDRDENLKKQYHERINNLLTAGYAEKTTAPPTGGRTWYLPHFPVVNPDKEKIRLVHDAAAKSHGCSLNDMLLPGPDLLQSLPGVIMKFRQHPVAVSADIKEMFMQIKIQEADRDALRFLWRGDRRDNKPPDQYRMTSLIFGATSSPCTALYIKNKNAQEYENEDPTAARAIRENHYMDDYLHSYATVQEAKQITTGVDRIHRRAGFELRGWASNSKQAIEKFTRAGATTVEIGGSEIEKTLGLLWRVNEDTLGFRVNRKRVPPEVIENRRTPTKREALSLIMSVFDPLGLISPVLTPAKRIMQDTWKYKTDWDEAIPEALRTRWRTWVDGLRTLDAIRIPRCYDYEPAMDREIHTFVDASEEAYAAVVYIRSTRADGTVHVALAAAKSRVTPTKPVSIPRLELQAAVVGARLARSVEEGHDFKISKRTFWSDSRTVLAWVRNEPRAYKTFVAHRLAEIEDITKKNEWRWVPTAQNPADDATRSTPHDFGPQHRWFTGPEFLKKNEDLWPSEKKQAAEKTGEEKEICAAQSAQPTSPIIDFNRFSRWVRLVRTMGRVLQFIDRCRPPQVAAAARRKRTKKGQEKDPEWNTQKPVEKGKKINTPSPREERKFVILEARYLQRAERALIIASQQETYAKERRKLLEGHSHTEVKESSLTGLSVVLEKDGVMRLRGRVNEAGIDYEAANPAILCGRHRYTKLYIQHVHEKLHHGGVEIVVNELRQRLWIVRIRPATKEVIKSCPRCRILRAKPASPSTGNLPAARLAHHKRPFTYTGLDYFGPIEITVSRHREKRYVALFTCLTSRALHLEVVASLSADSAINALRRFIARRGYPAEVWSDNATCFRAANNELANAWRAIEEEAAARHINWRFLPPAAPFMAGAWERMVRTVKEALRATLHEQRPSEETLTTLLAEVEATVNSRPLTHVAVTPDTPAALTPNMILLGPNCYVPPPGAFEDTDADARAHWRRAQLLADTFWRRWVREYLPLLQERRDPCARGNAPKVGDLVVICDPSQPRNTWPRGRVTATYPGKDGEVRVVDVTTSGGRVLRRATKRIVVINSESRDATAGGMFTTTP